MIMNSRTKNTITEYKAFAKDIEDICKSKPSYFKLAWTKLNPQLCDLEAAIKEECLQKIHTSAAVVRESLNRHNVQVNQEKRQWLLKMEHLGKQDTDGGQFGVTGQQYPSNPSGDRESKNGARSKAENVSKTQSKGNAGGGASLRGEKLDIQPQPIDQRVKEEADNRSEDQGPVNRGPYTTKRNVAYSGSQSCPAGGTNTVDGSVRGQDRVHNMETRTGQQLQEKDTEIEQLNKQIQGWEERDKTFISKQHENEKRIKELATKLSEKKEEIESLKGSNKEEIEKLKSSKAKSDMKLKNQENEIANLQMAITDRDKKLQSLEEDSNSKLTRFKEERKKHLGYIKELENTKMSQQEQMQSLTTEKNDLSTRYSQLASEKLKHNNPDIVDLSDPNRAMKLAEKYSDIYNDSWTDALLAQQALDLPDRVVIFNLLDVLEESFRFCEGLAINQFESLSNLLLHPCQDPNKAVKKAGGLEKPRMSSPSRKVLLDLRRQTMTNNVEEVTQSFLSHMHRQMKSEAEMKRMVASKTYYQKCAEICWLMVLHDPPLYMRRDIKPGSKVDSTLYTVLSKGDKVDYLVWPPLYNGEGGGLLAKGVVEVVQTFTKKASK